VVCYGYAENFQHILTRYVGQWLWQCFCYSPPGILKYDFFASGDIQLKVIRCSPCCNVVHLLLARAGVDWWNDKNPVSSANFTSELPGCNGFRSAAVTVYASGPMPDPCTMLAEMLAVDDSSLLAVKLLGTCSLALCK